MDNRHLFIALSLQKGIGPKTMLNVIQHWPDLNQLFHERHAPEALERVLKNMNWQLLEDSLKWAEQKNCYIVTYLDDDYPVLLRHIIDPPPILYLAGNKQALQHIAMAVVGSRKPIAYTERICRQWSSYFARHDLALISGLAIGVDSLVHQACLAEHARTLAVLGSGLEQIYPSCNLGLAHAIQEHGLIISEFYLKTHAMAHHFPRRNRIISGLARASLIMQAAEKSGTMITAKYAIEHNRELYVLPGPVDNPHFYGSHRLLQEGANVALTAEALLQDFQFQAKKCYN